MILQALHDLYDRQTALDSQSLAPPGFQHKEIHFYLVLDEEGNFKQLRDMRVEDDKKRKNRAKAVLVPQEIKRTSGLAANLLWDNPKYVLGYSSDPQKQQDAQKAQQCFIEKIKSLPEDALALPSIKAVLKFLDSNPLQAVMEAPDWKEVEKTPGALLTFRVGWTTLVISEEPDVLAALKRLQANEGVAENLEQQICLITGEKDEIERLHPRIKGVLGSQSVGADIVSFNLDAFNSYGKKQGFNAPIGKKAAFAYTTALNHLLGKDSRQKIQLGETTVVFWAEKPTERASVLENAIPELLSDYFQKDDPAAGTGGIKALYDSPWKGVPSAPDDDEGNRFYVLGLSPNNARIAVRFWHVLPLNDLGMNIWKHFDDLKIVCPPSEASKYLPIIRLIKTLGLEEGREEKLKADFFESILTNTPYPWEILPVALQRACAEPKNPMPFERACLIKGFLNRWYRDNEKKENTMPLSEEQEKKLKPELDWENKNIGYCSGRVFAILEKIQEEADSELKVTIGTAHFGAASTMPATAFRHLFKLNKHWLNVLARKNKGRSVNLEKELGKAMYYCISAPDQSPSFPPRLDLLNQGNFAVGYYHQRQELFKSHKKESDNTSNDNTEAQPNDNDQ